MAVVLFVKTIFTCLAFAIVISESFARILLLGFYQHLEKKQSVKLEHNLVAHVSTIFSEDRYTFLQKRDHSHGRWNAKAFLRCGGDSGKLSGGIHRLCPAMWIDLEQVTLCTDFLDTTKKAKPC